MMRASEDEIDEEEIVEASESFNEREERKKCQWVDSCQYLTRYRDRRLKLHSV